MYTNVYEEDTNQCARPSTDASRPRWLTEVVLRSWTSKWLVEMLVRQQLVSSAHQLSLRNLHT